MLGALVIVVAAGAVIASGSSNTASKVNNGSTKTPSGSTTAPTAFKVGDEVKLGDWTVKVWAVTDPYTSTNQFLKPQAGFRWVSLDTEVKNAGKDSKAVSSLLCFKVQDATNREYDESITSGVNPGPPDGDIPAGQSKRGNVVFEVPTLATGLKLNFKCDLFSSGQATIALS